MSVINKSNLVESEASIVQVQRDYSSYIAQPDETILVTGANGFIGLRVVKILLEYGFRSVRCIIRSSKNFSELEKINERSGGRLEVLRGDLLSHDDCIRAAEEAVVIYHLALGSTGKSFPNAFNNSVIPTRNLLDAALNHGSLRRFVNISSFAVYSNKNKPKGRLLDELCPLELHPEQRGDAYAFAKLKQDQLVMEYSKKYGIKYVLLRPGAVYGPGNKSITGRVGIDTFGIFLHLGGSNQIPLTYVDNCAEAIVLAGLVKGVDGEVFNVVDDNLPSSRQFLRLYKEHVNPFTSIYIPHSLSYFLCFLWEKYSNFSEGQLPPVFSRTEWHAYWKKTWYSNQKLKKKLGWKMRVSTEEGLKKYFEYCRGEGKNA